MKLTRVEAEPAGTRCPTRGVMNKFTFYLLILKLSKLNQRRL